MLRPQAPYFSIRGKKGFLQMQTYLYEFPKSHFRYSTQYLSVHDEVFTSSWILYGLVFLTNKGCFPTTPASKEFEQFYWRVFWVFHCNCSCSKPCSTTSVVGTGNIFSYFLLLWHFPELNSDWFFFFLILICLLLNFPGFNLSENIFNGYKAMQIHCSRKGKNTK